MPRFLKDIKIVDLLHSEWDRDKSDPKQGKYVFTVKKYIQGNYSRNPDWFFSWGHYDPRDQMQDCMAWIYQYDYSFVTTEDGFWPEGIVPNAEGRYVFRDAVLMKRPLLEELRDRKANRDRANMAIKGKVDKFQSDLKKEGGELDEQTLRSLMGEHRQ